MVLRSAWYRFGLFLYNVSSFFLSLSASFLFALLMIDEMALWHREGMSSMFGGSLSLGLMWPESVCGMRVLLDGVGRVFVRGVCGICLFVDDTIGGVAEFC